MFADRIKVVGSVLSDRRLGLGVVNPRTDTVENVAFKKLCNIVAAAEKLRKRFG